MTDKQEIQATIQPSEDILNVSQEEEKLIKYKDNLFLGSLLPGQSTAINYSIQDLANQVQFLTVHLTNPSVAQGFSLSKNRMSEQKVSLNLVLKAKSVQKLMIHIFAQNCSKSEQVKGTMKITIGKQVFLVNLSYNVQVPKIFCPKFLYSQKQGLNLLRITINKFVTNQGRINMINMQKYPMQFEVQVVGTNKLVDKDCPYNISTPSSIITAGAEKPFMFTVSLSTNIFFKGSMNNFKKVVIRKLLLLKTNSSIIYTIPLQIIVVFVKQPEIKQ